MMKRKMMLLLCACMLVFSGCQKEEPVPEQEKIRLRILQPKTRGLCCSGNNRKI